MATVMKGRGVIVCRHIATGEHPNVRAKSRYTQNEVKDGVGLECEVGYCL